MIFRPSLACALLLAAAPAMADCTWASGNNAIKPLTFNAGTYFAPRDIPFGSALTSHPAPTRTLSFGDTLRCSAPSFYSTTLIGPLAVATPVDYLAVPGNALLQTNVPGVGLAIYMTGFTPQWNAPADNPNRFIPVTLTYDNPTPVTMPSLQFRYALIKTGEIAAGSHSINQVVASGTSNMGPMFDLTFTATVSVAGCSMPAAPGNQIDVPMGTWEKRVFNGKNSTTPAHRSPSPSMPVLPGATTPTTVAATSTATTPTSRSTATRPPPLLMRPTAFSACRAIPPPKGWPSKC